MKKLCSILLLSVMLFSASFGSLSVSIAETASAADTISAGENAKSGIYNAACNAACNAALHAWTLHTGFSMRGLWELLDSLGVLRFTSGYIKDGACKNGFLLSPEPKDCDASQKSDDALPEQCHVPSQSKNDAVSNAPAVKEPEKPVNPVKPVEPAKPAEPNGESADANKKEENTTDGKETVKEPEKSDSAAKTPSKEQEQPETPKIPETPKVPESPKAPENQTASGGPSGSQAGTSDSSVSDFEKQVVAIVNRYRAQYGLSALTINIQLCTLADRKSEDMLAKNYFAHESPTYGSAFDMMKAAGVSYRFAGENLAMGYYDPEAVVTAWMNSPGHRKNILSENFTQIGVGYVENGGYWTQMFIG